MFLIRTFKDVLIIANLFKYVIFLTKLFKYVPTGGAPRGNEVQEMPS